MTDQLESTATPSAGRRTFLRWATGVSALVSGLLAGIPALRVFISPTFRRPAPEDWIKLGEADLFDVDVPTKVDFVETVSDAWVENRVLHSVWVHTEDGENFSVYSGRCTHLGCAVPFAGDEDRFHCVCHQSTYDKHTALKTNGPAPRGLDLFHIAEVNGSLIVNTNPLDVMRRDDNMWHPEQVEVLDA